MNFKLGISTCPNDTFIFAAILNNFLNTSHSFQVIMDDVEVLNKIALNGSLDIIKVSYGVIPKLLDNYSILKTGGALGFGCGPLVVSKNHNNINELYNKKIGIPGLNTSAFRIFKLFYGDNFNFVELRFDKIMPAILSGKIDAGIIIHEGRFTYSNLGLVKLIDLGNEWEVKYNAPIPLGAIIIKNQYNDYSKEINNLIIESINFAEINYDKLLPFIKKYAQELSDDVINKHINLFVNKYSKGIDNYIGILSKFLECDESCFV